MSKIISVDYGRSTVKSVAGFGLEEQLLIPSVVSYDHQIVDTKAESTPATNLENNPLNFLKAKINGRELAVGKVAQDAEYNLNTTNYDDIDDQKTNDLILTSIALLVGPTTSYTKINLITTLSVDQYNIKKDDFANRFEDKHFKIKLYDYLKGQYTTTKFYIDNVIVNRQGFSAFMHYILNQQGNIQTSKSDILDYTVGVIDLGKYSIDPFFCDSLDPISMRNETDRIPGMNKAFRNIQSRLIKEHDIRPQLYKVQKNLELNKEFRKNGQPIEITDILNSEYEQLAANTVGNIKNKLDMSLTEVDKWLICGGGANSGKLLARLSNELERELEVISEPRLANALGGLKIGQRQFREN
ncbi:ParM/StbA family protein [Natroniella sulfidigena]|uniref:ParM/StbA family protein n=1 Tax=Natroniella sulfidigena TaxID=723921 RepID=UPI00200A8067|nr:ParM/StbA family protein [Natroniella sulfidigena]MCK8817445.1 ParM/StbA family protein [Natroniella sulfidigena]